MKNLERVGLWVGSIGTAGPVGFWLALTWFDQACAAHLFSRCAALAKAWANDLPLRFSSELDKLLWAVRLTNPAAWWSAVIASAGMASALGLTLEWGASRKSSTRAPGGAK